MSIIAAPTKPRRLFYNGASVGNGADLTQDTLHSFTLAAGQLANVGDTLRIRSGGTLGATTDTKTARIVFGGTTVASAQGTTSGITVWALDLLLTKTGSNTQSYIANGLLNAGSVKITTGTLTATDTATISIAVTGQNSTNSVAGSITAQLTTVDLN